MAQRPAGQNLVSTPSSRPAGVLVEQAGVLSAAICAAAAMAVSESVVPNRACSAQAARTGYGPEFTRHIAAALTSPSVTVIAAITAAWG